MSETDLLMQQLVATADRGGDLGEKAAAQFLAGCEGILWLGHPWLERDGEYVWIDWDRVLDGTVDLSGGTVAAWRIARSIVRGDMGEAWRLDPSRRRALMLALATHLGVPRG